LQYIVKFDDEHSYVVTCCKCHWKLQNHNTDA